MKVYRHLFFDLDRTLWDFDKNAREAFADIYSIFKLKDCGIGSLDDFVKSYHLHNDVLWELYRQGKIEKEYLRWKRFEDTLGDFGISNKQLAMEIGHEYITISPQKVNLLPNTLKTLDYLYLRYPLYIITNGFEEVQFTKLANSNLAGYFQFVITSEAAGFKKPDQGIFNYALKLVNADPSESLMIGDDLITDISGAMQAGMDAIFFNPEQIAHNGGIVNEIFDLIELTKML